ncbi:uncharacterized protein DKFZp434B061-like [Xenopus tropicalis]|uniref:Uncharacterized protein DKFZp434B061-like n=1 Tax=Xenopus tropicalis TaxID=8364 RepID=A0A8J1JXM7_XENTR|nr:uncharacterized protein DKFZp434B061-like [Xenopus tropicalis]
MVVENQAPVCPPSFILCWGKPLPCGCRGGPSLPLTLLLCATVPSPKGIAFVWPLSIQLHSQAFVWPLSIQLHSHPPKGIAFVWPLSIQLHSHPPKGIAFVWPLSIQLHSQAFVWPLSIQLHSQAFVWPLNPAPFAAPQGKPLCGPSVSSSIRSPPREAFVWPLSIQLHSQPPKRSLGVAPQYPAPFAAPQEKPWCGPSVSSSIRSPPREALVWPLSIQLHSQPPREAFVWPLSIQLHSQPPKGSLCVAPQYPAPFTAPKGSLCVALGETLVDHSPYRWRPPTPFLRGSLTTTLS